MNIRRIAKAAIVTTTITAATLAAASAAEASTLSFGFGHTTFSQDSYHAKYYGTVYDDAADGACVRVYGMGYNAALHRWGTGNYKGQACGKGDHVAWSESPTVYSDNYAVSLCKGMPNSTHSNCTAYYTYF